MIKPPKLGERDLEIGTFMGTPHRLHSGCYQLGIKCNDGSTEYIAAQQVKHIAKPITTASATTASRLTHARITAEPDILVGVSDFWRFFKGVTEIAPSQYIVQTSIGNVICGQDQLAGMNAKIAQVES